MHIASLPSAVRSLSDSRHVWIAAACSAAIAAGGIAVMSDGGGDIAPSVAPTVVAPAASGDDLSRYDGALLHHHGVRVPLSEPSVEPTVAQRRAAERFHHR